MLNLFKRKPVFQYEDAIRLIQSKKFLLITAGAGMGVDSGLPDFRGSKGFWTKSGLMKNSSMSYRDLARPKLFRNLPSRAWGFYGQRIKGYIETVPHEGFDILKKWTEENFSDYFVFTSNVDNQFQKAGFPDNKIVECHGSILHKQCLKNCCKKVWDMDSIEFEIDARNFALGEFPKCPKCGGPARPNVHMFADLEWIGSRTAKQERRYNSWLESINRDELLIIELGAGVIIKNIRLEGKSLGVPIIRINPDESEVEKGASISTGSLEALKQLNGLLSQGVSGKCLT